MSGTAMQQTRPKPRTLRDFLSESSISCSSDGFKSFPKNPIPSTTMRSLIEMDLKSPSSWSRNLNPRILNSPLNAVVKRFSVKSPSILPRSLSRKLSKRRSSENNRGSGEIKITVKIKDILRWTSFRDLPEKAEERPSQPLDFASSTVTSSCCSSNGSSWSDSDFTCGYLSSCDGNFGEAARNDAGASKTFSPRGKDSVDATTGKAVWTKDTFPCQEEESQSPVSVLQIGEDEFSPFDQSLANIERTKQKCMHRTQRSENLTNLDLTFDRCLSVNENTSSEEEYNDDEGQDRTEKRARKLLHCVKATSSVQCSKANLDQLLLDFFRDELKINDDEDEFEWEILRVVKDWVDDSIEYELEHNDKEACVRDMDRRERWSKFEEEKEELAMEIESNILESLVVELLNEKS